MQSDLSDSDRTFLPSSTELDGGITSTTASERMFPPASSESLSHELRHKQNNRDQKAVSTHITFVPDTPPLEDLPPSTSAAATIFPSRVLRPRHTVQPEPSKATSPVLSISSENEKHSPRKKRRRILQRVVADSSDSEVPAAITHSRIRLEDTRKDREAPRKLKSSVRAEQDPSITDATTHGTEPHSKTAKVLRLSIVKASCNTSMDESNLSASSEEDFEPISMRLRIKHRTQVDKKSSRQEDDWNDMFSSKQSQSSGSYVEERSGQTQSHKKKKRECSLESSEDDGEWTTSLNKVQSKNSNQRASTVKTSEAHEEDRHADAPSRMNKSQKGGETKDNGVVSKEQFEYSHSMFGEKYTRETRNTASLTRKGREGSEESDESASYERLLTKVQLKNKVKTALTMETSQADKEPKCPNCSRCGKRLKHPWSKRCSDCGQKAPAKKSSVFSCPVCHHSISNKAATSCTHCSYKFIPDSPRGGIHPVPSAVEGHQVGSSATATSNKIASNTTQSPGQKEDLSSTLESPKKNQTIQFDDELPSNITLTQSAGQSGIFPSTTRIQTRRRELESENELASTTALSFERKEAASSLGGRPKRRQGIQSEDELASNTTQSPEETEDLSSTKDSPKKRQPSTITVTQSSREKENLPNQSQREQSVDELASNVTVTQSTRQMKYLSLAKIQIERPGVESDDKLAPNTTPIPRRKEDLPSTGERPKTWKGIQFDNQSTLNIPVTQSPSEMERPNKRKRVLSGDDVTSNITVTQSPRQKKDLPSTTGMQAKKQRVESDVEPTSNITVTQSPRQKKDLPSTTGTQAKKQRVESDVEPASNITVTQSHRQKKDLPSTTGTQAKKQRVESDVEPASNITVTQSPRQKKDLPSTTGTQAKKQRVESDVEPTSNITVTQSPRQKKDLPSTTGTQAKKQRVESDVEPASNATVTQSTRQTEGLPSTTNKPKRRRGVPSVASNTTVTQNSTQKHVKKRRGVHSGDLASVTATQSPRQEVVLSTRGRPRKKRKVQFDDVSPTNIIDRSTRQKKGVLLRRGRPSKQQRVESDNDSASNVNVTHSTKQKKGVLSTRGRPRGRPRKNQRVHFDDDLPSNVTVTQNTSQKGDVRSARGRPKKKRQRNAPDSEFDRSRVPQHILSSSCFLAPQPTQSVVHLPEPAEDGLESEVYGIETVNLENDCVISLQPEFSVEEPIQTSIGVSTKQTDPATSELFSETEAPGERDDFLKELSEYGTHPDLEPAAGPLSPFDELLLSTANLGHSSGEGLWVTNSATPGKVSPLGSNQLLWKDYEEEVLKVTGNNLSSGEGNGEEYSGSTDSADEDCLSEHAAVSIWAHSSEPTRHNRTCTQSKALTIPGQYHQATTHTKENIKLSSRTTLFNVRKAPQKSAMSHSSFKRPPPSESVVEEEAISAQGSVKVAKNGRKRKLESTESSSGNETDSLAPIQVGARLYSPNSPTIYHLLMRKPATGEEERLEQASRHRDRERPTTRKKITEKGQHMTTAARKAGVRNSNEKAALAKENHEPLHLDVTLEDEDSEDQNSQKTLFQDTTDSGSEDNIIHPLTSEHSQPETVNLIDEEVENTQMCTQYDYAPLEKIAYASESETVVSDSTASCSPVYDKTPYLPRLYTFRKRH